jgi:hypothetical protein
MLATLYNVAVDLPIYESAWLMAVLWLCRMLCCFAIITSNHCCCGGTCTGCTGATPEQLQVVIAGVTDGTCANCDTHYQGTFVVDRTLHIGAGCGGSGDITAAGTTDGLACQWSYVVSTTCSVGFSPLNRLTVTVRDAYLLGGGTPGNTYTRVFFWRTSDVFCGNFMEFERNDTSSPSQTGIMACSSLSNYEVPSSDPFDTMRTSVCIQDGTSAFVTAL